MQVRHVTEADTATVSAIIYRMNELAHGFSSKALASYLFVIEMQVEPIKEPPAKASQTFCTEAV